MQPAQLARPESAYVAEHARPDDDEHRVGGPQHRVPEWCQRTWQRGGRYDASASRTALCLVSIQAATEQERARVGQHHGHLMWHRSRRASFRRVVGMVLSGMHVFGMAWRVYRARLEVCDSLAPHATAAPRTHRLDLLAVCITQAITSGVTRGNAGGCRGVKIKIATDRNLHTQNQVQNRDPKPCTTLSHRQHTCGGVSAGRVREIL